MEHLSVFNVVELTSFLIIVGAIAGFLAGLFGIGGGAILVPVFYECFRVVDVPLDVRMPLCVGTSLAIIVPPSIRSYRAQLARGAVDRDILRRWRIPIVAGVIFASVIARFAPEQLFKIIFVIVEGLAAFRLLFGRDSWRLGEELPHGALMSAYGFACGFISTLMGIGGGLLSTLTMTFYGRPIHQAIATSSGVAILVTIPAALGYVYAGWHAASRYPEVAALQWPMAIGYVSLLGAALVIPTSLITSPLGVKVAHTLSKRTLEIMFGAYLLSVSTRFIISLLVNV